MSQVENGYPAATGFVPVPMDTESRPRRIDDAAVAAVVVDGAGRVVEATAAAAAVLGRRPADLVGRELLELAVTEWGWVVRNAVLRLASGSLEPFELLLRGRSGRRSLVQMLPRRLAAPQDSGEARYMLVWLEQRQSIDPPEPSSDAEAELRRHAYALLRTHEAERGRVAAALHDGVAPLVVMAKFLLEDALGRLARGSEAEARVQVRDAVERLREVLADVRRISTELRPSSLEDLGLVPTIAWHCRCVAQACETLQVSTDLAIAETAIADALKLDLFRIVQEALSNVVRHARATEVKVALRAASGRLELKIEDNGIGFDPSATLRADATERCLGLQSMHKRADATGGALAIVSSPWRGTRIEAHWPIEHEAALPAVAN